MLSNCYPKYFALQTFAYWKNYFAFHKLSMKILSFRKNEIEARDHLSMIKCTQHQIDTMKKAEFCHFGCQKGHFARHSGRCWQFSCLLFFSNLGLSKVCLGHFLHYLRKSSQKYMSCHPNQKSHFEFFTS